MNTLLLRGKRLLMGLRRRLYGLRALVPGLRERHRLELMVGPLGFWDELQRYQLQALRANGLMAHHRLLDIGCGPLQGGVAFIGYLDSCGYTGVDIDPVRMEAAHAQVLRHGLAPKSASLVLSSTFGDRELGDEKFDYIWASQILYYFDDEAMATLLALVRRRLSPGGKFLGDIFGPGHYLYRFPEPGYVMHSVEAMQRLAREQGLRARCLGEIVQYGYPRRLTLHSNLLLEFTLPE